MGLKVRLGLAFSGLFLSSMFGVNMLSGIKDYVDTTGNLMVDIADGIGMVSKGIEYIESYLDPEAKPAEPDTEKGEPPGNAGSSGAEAPGGAATAGDAAPPRDAASTSGAGFKSDSAPTPSKVDKSGGVPADQPAVICQKGKCYPYDPNRVKNNLNLEAKQGVILTPAAKPSSSPSGKQQHQHTVSGKRQHRDDEEEDEDEEASYSKRKQQNSKARQATVAAQDSNKVLQKSSPKSSTKTQTQSTTDTESTTTSSSTTTTTATISPSPNQNITSSDSPENSNVSASKKMLTAFRGLLDNTSKLLVRLVSRMFPWNRRARRRLNGEEDDL